MSLFTSVALLIPLSCFLQVCSSQVVVSEGDSVVLPCVCTDTPQDPTLIWKDPQDDILLKLDKGRETPYRQGVHTFQANHKAGNFSIYITNVKLTDTGTYECHIPSVDCQKNVRLTVNERKVEEPNILHRGGAAVPVLSACALTLVLLHVLL